MGSLSLLQGIFPTQGSNPGLPHCRQILYQLSQKGSPRIWEWVAYPFSGDLPDPRINPGSPVLQVDSLPMSYQGSLNIRKVFKILSITKKISSPICGTSISFSPLPVSAFGKPFCKEFLSYSKREIISRQSLQSHL